MSVVRLSVAAVGVATALACVAPRLAAATSNNPSFLWFGGADLWRYGDFLYGGFLWSPGGVNADGFTLKLLVNGGPYTYDSTTLHTRVDGTIASAAALPGWRVTRDGLTVTAYAGPLVQDYRLWPYDPGAKLNGVHAGAQFATDIWYQPTAATMAAVSGAVASIGPTGYLRGAVGYRLFDRAYVGPEAAMLICGNFQEAQFGAHVTALRVNGIDWSAGGGWATDSDRRSGPYLRIGFAAKY